jgi:hypothetical protein
MKPLVRRFALPLAAVVILSPAAFVALGTIGELILGNWEAGRLFPFSNAHLREEALEGVYSPLSDPLFVLFSLLVAGCAFGPAMFWGALRASKSELRFVWLATVTGTGLIALTFQSELSGRAPIPIVAAAFFVLVACFGAGSAGIWLSSSVRAPAPTDGVHR